MSSIQVERLEWEEACIARHLVFIRILLTLLPFRSGFLFIQRHPGMRTRP